MPQEVLIKVKHIFSHTQLAHIVIDKVLLVLTPEVLRGRASIREHPLAQAFVAVLDLVY